jgi:hypothetical protein
VPVAVSGINNATKVFAGFNNACALLSDASVKCWGSNIYGQLNTENVNSSNLPLLIKDISNVRNVSLENNASCFVLNTSQIKCLGNNESGRLSLSINKINFYKPTLIGTTDYQAPTKPAALSAAAKDNQIDLAWRASTDNVGPIKYYIYKDEEYACGSYTCTRQAYLGSSDTASFIVPNLNPGTRYYFNIYAVDYAGNTSDYADIYSKTTGTSSVPVYRHYSPSRGAHFFTTNKAESDKIKSQGWNYEGTAWQVSNSTNSKPVYRHYSPSRGRHFYTTNKAESDKIKSQGWNYEGIAWYASPTQTSIPIFRHYSPSRGAHFYTRDKNESDKIKSQGWNFEGIEYYAF